VADVDIKAPFYEGCAARSALHRMVLLLLLLLLHRV
jgi:hypothetical protein